MFKNSVKLLKDVIKLFVRMTFIGPTNKKYDNVDWKSYYLFNQIIIDDLDGGYILKYFQQARNIIIYITSVTYISSNYYIILNKTHIKRYNF